MPKSLYVFSAMFFALAPGLAVAQSGSGHTTLPVGNFGAGSILPTGQVITPTAAPGSTLQVLSTGLRSDGNADAAEAVNTALSPDGKSLLVLTSGWNRDNRLPNGTPITFPTLDPKTGAAVGTTTLSEWSLFTLSMPMERSPSNSKSMFRAPTAD
jgi:hypothetical protein